MFGLMMDFCITAFVSCERKDGDSVWFIEESIFEMNRKYLVKKLLLKLMSGIKEIRFGKN